MILYRDSKLTRKSLGELFFVCTLLVPLNVCSAIFANLNRFITVCIGFSSPQALLLFFLMLILFRSCGSAEILAEIARNGVHEMIPDAYEMNSDPK